ncbi:hypothetical protein Taro_051775 [Colocasia esculenta]|uniref:Uncharacterized protein n=1 Tax=Colocasia esculenta TaxID=4460 RepID=A0A843XHV6_COLES|nr:hypothetical protein [Colocasia esculenta]
MVAPECVVPRPHGMPKVEGSSACRPSTLWRSKGCALRSECDGHGSRALVASIERQRLHACHVSCVPADVRCEKATPFYVAFR